MSKSKKRAAYLSRPGRPAETLTEYLLRRWPRDMEQLRELERDIRVNYAWADIVRLATDVDVRAMRRAELQRKGAPAAVIQRYTEEIDLMNTALAALRV